MNRGDIQHATFQPATNDPPRAAVPAQATSTWRPERPQVPITSRGTKHEASTCILNHCYPTARVPQWSRTNCSTKVKFSVPALIAIHLAVAGITYSMTDRRPVDTDVNHDGLFRLTTTKILAATVESLREENKLQVFSYKGTANVQAERRWFWVLGGHQQLSVPAVVTYHIDMSELSLADVSFNEKAKIVTVRLPKVALSDIAFRPENATTINGGILLWDDDQVEALRKLNYRNARRAMVAQAQQPGLLNAAKRQAQSNVTSLFEIPLRIAGQPDVKVVAEFQ